MNLAHESMNWIPLVVITNLTGGAFVVWPGILFPNSRGNKAEADLRPLESRLAIDLVSLLWISPRHFLIYPSLSRRGKFWILWCYVYRLVVLLSSEKRRLECEATEARGVFECPPDAWVKYSEFELTLLCWIFHRHAHSPRPRCFPNPIRRGRNMQPRHSSYRFFFGIPGVQHILPGFDTVQIVIANFCIYRLGKEGGKLPPLQNLPVEVS